MRNLFLTVVLTMTILGSVNQARVADAGDCCPAPVCCVPPPPVCCVPPPPVEVTWCVQDPCTCCKYEVSACLPACCKCETPCLVGWKPGLFGRKILTYKFECGECVEVIITKHGKTIVRS